jgi:hypothetical protein
LVLKTNYFFFSGQRFAMLESKIVLSTLLRRFKFEALSNTKPPIIANQLVLKSMNGINLVVSRRWKRLWSARDNAEAILIGISVLLALVSWLVNFPKERMWERKELFCLSLCYDIGGTVWYFLLGQQVI